MDRHERKRYYDIRERQIGHDLFYKHDCHFGALSILVATILFLVFFLSSRSDTTHQIGLSICASLCFMLMIGLTKEFFSDLNGVRKEAREQALWEETEWSDNRNALKEFSLDVPSKDTTVSKIPVWDRQERYRYCNEREAQIGHDLFYKYKCHLCGLASLILPPIGIFFHFLVEDCPVNYFFLDASDTLFTLGWLACAIGFFKRLYLIRELSQNRAELEDLECCDKRGTLNDLIPKELL